MRQFKYVQRNHQPFNRQKKRKICEGINKYITYIVNNDSILFKFAMEAFVNKNKCIILKILNVAKKISPQRMIQFKNDGGFSRKQLRVFRQLVKTDTNLKIIPNEKKCKQLLNEISLPQTLIKTLLLEYSQTSQINKRLDRFRQTKVYITDIIQHFEILINRHLNKNDFELKPVCGNNIHGMFGGDGCNMGYLDSFNVYAWDKSLNAKTSQFPLIVMNKIKENIYNFRSIYSSFNYKDNINRLFNQPTCVFLSMIEPNNELKQTQTIQTECMIFSFESEAQKFWNKIHQSSEINEEKQMSNESFWDDIYDPKFDECTFLLIYAIF